MYAPLIRFDNTTIERIDYASRETPGQSDGLPLDSARGCQKVFEAGVRWSFSERRINIINNKSNSRRSPYCESGSWTFFGFSPVTLVSCMARWSRIRARIAEAERSPGAQPGWRFS